MGNESSEYLPLAASPTDSSAPTRRSERRWLAKFTHRELGLLLVVVLQSLALVILSLGVQRGQSGSREPSKGWNFLYSPAEKAVEWEVRTFTAGREQKTPYQGYGDDVDAAWLDLYDHTILRLPKSEAALLPNKTYPLKDEPGYYIAALDVFHQIHCLNTVRKAVYIDHYRGHDSHLTDEHISHCIDSVRQSLMCNADISVNVWQWSEEVRAVVGYSTNAHTCKNYNKIQGWARENRLHKWIDIQTHIPDELPDIPIIS
ncbi:hypothetical protein BKA70DRAFT_1296991 [Coprinopsis sp. MPI-PUGE-AT-0042]|nr:hypothetical protein BKA70DRAFT_1296991 [Coprinopsis sp. MPI-PUGE-AT-0042]